ncbi:class I SAM-dependent methyltransferase [Naumannella halotolerans]|uniref:Methyltransferase family protein n=1 Tax=Naumannella halotolerans TaxID=993414 RepID=A0A4R7J2J0_9ACTN|nr:class I SAM-dependent methyltransferase [Naumannella halotolerans]TDT31380.1 hypothetical protein CLV29_2802 [Naumannella halotolerans]
MQDDHSIDADLHRRLRESFTSGGDRYEQLRPSYPAEAVDWLLTPATHEVADIGAGTGKLTRLLAGRGVRAVAIDPALDMLSSSPAPSVCPEYLSPGRATKRHGRPSQLAGFDPPAIV